MDIGLTEQYVMKRGEQNDTVTEIRKTAVIKYSSGSL